MPKTMAFYTNCFYTHYDSNLGTNNTIAFAATEKSLFSPAFFSMNFSNIQRLFSPTFVCNKIAGFFTKLHYIGGTNAIEATG
jgi:hypothetical protein